MPEPSEAGPSSRPISEGELIWCTYRDLNEDLEGARRSRPLAEVKKLVEVRLPELQKCAAPLPTANVASQSQITSGHIKLPDGTQIKVDQEHRELTEKISERFNLDQVEAFIALKRFLQSEDRSLDILVASTSDKDGKQSGSRSGKSSKSSIAPSLADELLDAFNVFFFEETLYLTRCVSALLRIAEDSYSEYFDIAQSTLSTLATPKFGKACVDRFKSLLQQPLPLHIRDAPRYSPFWAKQGLKEQLALLEVVFLLFYGHVNPDAAFVISVLTIVQETNLGQHQANEAFFDAESVQLLSSVRHLLAFVAVESLDLERAMDGYEFAGQASSQPALVESSDCIAQALDLLEATEPDPGRSPILLAWALILKKAEDTLSDMEDDSSAQLPDHLTKVKDILTPTDGGQPIWARLASAAMSPQLALFPTLRSMAVSPLLSNDSSYVSFEVSVASSLAFRAVFKGLLLSITEVVKPEFVTDFDALISLWEATFDASTTSELSAGAATGVAALSAQFWDVDYQHETRRAVLETASRRWPVHFRPFIRLLKALTGTCNRTSDGADLESKSALRVLQHFGSISSIAQVLPPTGKSLRPPWEVIESADYSVLDYRATSPIPLFGSQWTIKPGTCGRMVSELGRQPVVVVWELEDDPISGWTLVRDVLASFVKMLPDNNAASRLARTSEDPFGAAGSHPLADFQTLSPDSGDDAVVAAEILDLFASVLAGAPDQAAQLLDHLDTSGSSADTDDSTDSAHRSVQPSLIALTQRILDQALGVQQAMPTRLISSAYSLLNLLLPHRPTEVWLALRSSNLITGSSGQISWTKTSSAFNASSSLLTCECPRGSFQGLHSLLVFHSSLLAELQRSQFAITPDLLRVKVDVLLRGISWICESIWSEFQSWRYTRAVEKLSIGLHCTRMLSEILTDRTLTTGIAKEIPEMVTDLLVSRAALLHLAPLVNSLATSQETVERFHRSGHHAEAEKAHDLALASLKLARHIIEQRQDLSTRGVLPERLGLLERMFFDGSAVSVRSLPSGSRRSSRVELISTVFSHLSQGFSTEVCREAALLVTAICISTRPTDTSSKTSSSSAGPALSMIGHMGSSDEVKGVMTAILGLLDNTHQEVQLRASLWKMVATIISKQPALASMLLSGNRFGTSSSSTDVAPETDDSSAEAATPATALRTAVDAFIIWEAYWEGEDIVLLDAVLHFFASVWSQPENSAALKAVKSDDRFWKALISIITAKIDSPPHDAPGAFADQSGDETPRTEHHDSVRNYCYRMTAKARSLYIMSSDMEFSGSLRDQKSFEHASQLVNNGSVLGDTLEAIANFECDPALPADYESRMAACFPELPLRTLRNPPKSNEFDSRREYGDGYVYNTHTMRRKLEGFCGDDGEDEAQVDERVIHQVSLLVSSINLVWSIVDSQAAALRSWTAFLETFSRRARRGKEASQQQTQTQQSCLQAWKTIATITADETRDGPVMFGIHAERVKLLQVLLETAWCRELRSTNTIADGTGKPDEVQQLSEITDLVRRLGAHSVFTLQGSIQGSERSPFHRGILAILLLCSRRCRQVLQLSESRHRSSQSSRAHQVIHTAIDSFTSHAISALRLIVDNAVRLLSSSNSGADALAAAEEELVLVCSLLELLIRSDVSLAPHFWLAQMQECAVLPACVTLLRKCPQRKDDEGPMRDASIVQAPVFMPALLSLFLAMAAQQQPAEQMVLAGVMTALSSNALTSGLENGAISPTSTSGAGSNPAHACWLAMVRLSVSIVENLDGDATSTAAIWASATSRFIELELMGFVRLYGAQIGRALSFDPLSKEGAAAGRLASTQAIPSTGAAEAVSLAQLHELNAVVRLFLVMASADGFAEGSGREILSTFARKTIIVLQQAIHLIQRPHQLASLLAGDAMDEDDKPNTSRPSSPAEYEHVVDLMSSIASTSVAALWHQSRGLDILASDGSLPSQLSTTAALLRPTMRTSPSQPASVGSLLDLASFHIDRLNSGRGTTDESVTTIEQSIALAVSQLKINNSQPAGSKYRRTAESGIARDVASTIQSAISAVRGKQEGTSADRTDFLEHLNRVCEGL